MSSTGQLMSLKLTKFKGMKRMIIMIMMLAAGNSMAQDDVFSFYFDAEAMGQLKSVQTVNPRLFGKYELVDSPANEVRRAAGEFLVIDGTGIYLEKNRLLSISREEVRENSKYRVSKGWLHGVVENDSVPCALDEDQYFFLVPVKTYLYGQATGPERMVQISGSKYALFSQAESGYFSAIIVNFKQGGVDLNDVVFSKKDPNNIDQIEKKKIEEGNNGITTYLLSPTPEEWESFIFKSCFEVYDSYSIVIDQ